MLETKRDLLTASFIEVKRPDGYYFPHRSFHEFLVAEQIVLIVTAGEAPLVNELRLTPEVVQFVIGLMGDREIAKFKHWVWQYRGTMPEWAVELMVSVCDESSTLLSDSAAMASPWGFVVGTYGLLGQKWSWGPDLERFCKESLGEGAIALADNIGWMRLLIILNVLLTTKLRDMDVPLNSRLRELAYRADLDCVGRRKVLGSALIGISQTPTFCQVASWPAIAENFANLWFDLGQPMPATPKDKVKSLSVKQGKSPHRLRGVTKKSSYRD